MSLSKHYKNVLTYESLNLMKTPVSMNTLIKLLKKFLLNTNDDMRSNLMSYDVLILESNFHDVWVLYNGTLYKAPIG